MTETPVPASRLRRGDFRFFHRLRVRRAEVDMQKIVFSGHYLLYLDAAMGGYWRALALPYAESMEALGGDLYLKKAAVEYHAPAFYDDQLDIALRCERIGRSSIAFAAAVFRGDALLAGGELLYVYVDPAARRPQPVPPALRSVLLGYEAGEPVYAVHTGPWDALGNQAGRVRTAVFVDEQGIAPEDEWDADDATAIHAVVVNRLGQPLATGRLLRHGQGEGRIGRMAVHCSLRGSRLGRAVLDALVETARARGDHTLLLHSQRSAEGFYANAGFAPHGEPFDEVGIAHIEMRRALPPLLDK
ncbi:YbgC/FadM family acyl-CoA thioesterase [Xylophilus sp.]|uniref:YbgC/FadM family acyl-CoA thioesterase n=1 Tax=Xylophilus sp. TaxID=2653893 RepID=UPI0013B62D2E|nr:YbgC/FadM family acyl-CoA thioesterase [Xylophilus sp.]KAF1048712.1 MAG: Acetyltransferase [Xylophilus sp.]